MMAVRFLICASEETIEILTQIVQKKKNQRKKNLYSDAMAALKCFGVQFSCFETCLLAREFFAVVYQTWKNSLK